MTQFMKSTLDKVLLLLNGRDASMWSASVVDERRKWFGSRYWRFINWFYI